MVFAHPRYSANSFALCILLLSLDAVFSVRIGTISNAIFVTTDVNSTLLNMSCNECTCVALTVGAVGWNCVADNKTCQLISNYSSSGSYLARTINGSFCFKNFPFESLTTAVTTAVKTTTSTSTSTTALTPQWNPIGITVAGSAVGIFGNTASRLSMPYILRLDSSNALYISDMNNNRIQKWIIGNAGGTTVAGLANGIAGSSSNSLSGPVGLILDSNSNMYVSDKTNNRIMFWPNNASSGSLIAGTGFPGSANNQMNGPNMIDRDPSGGTLYIGDVNNHRIMRYLANASSGIVVAGGNGVGIDPTRLYYPCGFVFDSSTNSLIIANLYGHNVVRWPIGASNWTILAGSTIGISGSSPTLLNNPVGVTLDLYGNMYVADSSNHRIQFFVAGQSSGTTIVGITGLPGMTATQLYRPYFMILDSQFNLYVADTYNNRVQRFSPQ